MNDSTKAANNTDKPNATPAGAAEKLSVTEMPATLDALNAHIKQQVIDQLGSCLPDMVKALVPPSPEAVAAAEAKTAEDRAIEDSTRARRAREKEDKRVEKAAEQAAKERSRALAAATRGFHDAYDRDRDTVTVADLKAEGARLLVAFDNGTRFSLDDPIEIAASECQIDGPARRVLINRDITIGGDADELVIAGANLLLQLGKEKKIVHATLGAALPVGGGRSAKLPAGSLAFGISSAAEMPADAEG